jgi:predicted NBD/HSP70 family sugar kinase
MSAMQTSHGEIASAIEGFRVGIDLGGSKIEGVLMGPQGTELARHRVTTPRDGIVRAKF